MPRKAAKRPAAKSGGTRSAAATRGPRRRVAKKTTRSKAKPVKRGRSKPAGRKPAATPARNKATAVDMARKQRDISISEFFAKNRHLLGFDNPSKALLTTIKEGVDNSLDACEEAGIVPEIHIEIVQLDETRFRVAIEDNGPGIVRSQVPKIFGRLLYGSKFHRLRQSRGQQGIGISAAGMYGLLTTGRPVKIRTRTGKGREAHHFALVIDTKKNEPRVKSDRVVSWKKDHGTRVEIELEGAYRGGQHSVDAYIRQISLANPHATLHYHPPVAPRKSDAKEGEAVAAAEVRTYARVTKELPAETAEIKPHPYGVELGLLMQMFRDSRARNVKTCLQGDFSRVSARVAGEICERAGVPATRRPAEITRDEAERIHKTIKKTKLMNPSSDCIAPIGETLLLRALKSEVDADFFATATRRPTVYRGNPFLIEVGLAYGGSMAADEPISLYRYANRVPLQYQQGACAITRAVTNTDWRSYKLQQPRGALPLGPLLLIVHIASVWVPFTSESKEAIANYPEIIKEIRLGLQECGRRMATHVRKQRREADELKKRAYIEKYIPQVAIGLQEILGFDDRERGRVISRLSDVLERSRKL
jgi:DNA topoisomerase-6 subunit B